MGGLEAMAKVNQRKAGKLYAEIDRTGFYRGTARKQDRSLMNVTFRLATEELEKMFVKESTAAGFDGLKGHRSVGGMRASIYNAFPGRRQSTRSSRSCASSNGSTGSLARRPTASVDGTGAVAGVVAAARRRRCIGRLLARHRTSSPPR